MWEQLSEPLTLQKESLHLSITVYITKENHKIKHSEYLKMVNDSELSPGVNTSNNFMMHFISKKI